MNFFCRNVFLISTLWFAVMFMALTTGGCMKAGHDYITPEIPVYEDWHARMGGDQKTDETNSQTLATWWATLGDSKLSSLIERAVQGNLDLKKATARIREARARRGIAAADLYPKLDATGSVSRSRSVEDLGGGMTADLYAVGFDASWELDIFGGVRRSVEAAEANIQFSQEDRHDVLVTLIAEVALNYTDVRTYQSRIAVAEANLKNQAETCRLTEWKFQAGLGDELAVQQAIYNRENTRSQIPSLRTGLEAAMNRIAVLLGEPPGNVHAEIEQPVPIPVPSLEVAIGVPADVLRRRPDVRKAERNLAGQTARVGVATADLYPKFALSGTIGLESLSSGSLFSSGSHTYSLGSGLTLPIFAGGSIRRNIEVQSALQEQYLIAYEASILVALEEVENALVAYAKEQDRRQSLIGAAEAAQQASKLAHHKYGAGLADFTNVLDAERSLLSFQDQLTQSEGAVTSKLVRLYKALGGGWTSHIQDEKK